MIRIDKAASFLFPNKCCGCGKVISADEELCRECVKARVHFCYGRGFCDVCGQKRNGCICTGRHFFNKAVFAFFYSGKVKNSVRSFKFRGRLFYGRLLAKQMFNAAEESGIIRNASVIVPIPMHPLKKLRRGYNQAEVLAKELSKLSGVPYASALQKLTFSGAQHDLGMLERTGNVAATFEVKTEIYTPDRKRECYSRRRYNDNSRNTQRSGENPSHLRSRQRKRPCCRRRAEEKDRARGPQIVKP